jgi:hypothetical protein
MHGYTLQRRKGRPALRESALSDLVRKVSRLNQTGNDSSTLPACLYKLTAASGVLEKSYRNSDREKSKVGLPLSIDLGPRMGCMGLADREKVLITRSCMATNRGKAVTMA